MLSPEDVAAARNRAAVHLEVMIDRVVPGTLQPGNCWLQARVRRVLRDHVGALRPGMEVKLRVDSRWRGQRCPPGDDLRLDIEDLVPGSTLAVYAERAGDTHSFAAVMGQAELLQGNPGMRPAEYLEACCATPDWQLERDLGHALGIEASLGACACCGAVSVSLYSALSGSCHQVAPEPADLARLRSLPDGPALKAFLAGWLERPR